MLHRRTTFPCISAHLSGGARWLERSDRIARRGFTLLELMVVVLIITIVSSIAIPGVVKRMKTNRTRQAAEDLAMRFRQARIRSMGRNSAVLLRYDDAAGTIELREGVQGPSAVAGCERRPESSCSVPADRWNTARSQQLDFVNYVGGGDFTVDAEFGGGPVTDLDICFAPSGRAYIRSGFASTTPFTPWTTPLRFNVDRTDDVGIQRSVLVTPTGNAQVVAAP